MNEENYINVGRDLTFQYHGKNGLVTRKIISAKDDITNTFRTYLAERMQEEVVIWFETVFLNFAKKDRLHKFYRENNLTLTWISQSIKYYFGDFLDRTWKSGEEDEPSPERYKDENIRKDTGGNYMGSDGTDLFIADCLNSLPAWAQDGEVLFGGRFILLLEGDDGFLDEVVDYLNARVANGDNISVISVPDAYRLTTVWKNKNLTDHKLPDVIDVDVKVFSELGNGYKILQLLTPKALDRESARCAHCIGKGGYDHLLKNEKNKFLSLRDSEDNAIATFHIVNTNQISQLKGDNNGPVQQDFWPMIKDFIIQNQLVMINDFDLIGLKNPKPK